jgi:hypothetical protein
MKRSVFIATLILFFCLMATSAMAQCSICTKTAQQLGEGPAKGMNTGILYLAFLPFAIIGVIAFRWWKMHKSA